MSVFEATADLAAFDQAINEDRAVIAKFQTKSCFKCRQLEPGLKQLQERMGGTLRIMDVDAEELPELADRYKIQGVPTLILFKDGGELTRCSGFQSTSMLREWVAPHVDG